MKTTNVVLVNILDIFLTIGFYSARWHLNSKSQFLTKIYFASTVYSTIQYTRNTDNGNSDCLIYCSRFYFDESKLP